MLVWMDLEMTGLDHTVDVIVEIATIITDDDLEIVAEGPDLVIHQPDEVLARMRPGIGPLPCRRNGGARKPASPRCWWSGFAPGAPD